MGPYRMHDHDVAGLATDGLTWHTERGAAHCKSHQQVRPPGPFCGATLMLLGVVWSNSLSHASFLLQCGSGS